MNKQIPQSLHTTAKTLGRKQGNLRATGFSDGFLDTTLKTRSKRERGRSGPRRTLTLSRIAGHCPGGGGTARAGGGAHFSSPRVQKNAQLENRKANDRCCTRAEVRGARDQQDRQEKRLNLDSGEGNATRTSETARRTHWPERKAN